MAEEKNRFSALRALREQRHHQEAEEDTSSSSHNESKASRRDDESVPASNASSEERKKKSIKETKGRNTVSEEPTRKPGRPPGRRSNPNYTQISAYIPLELLQEVQDELAKERRTLKQRTARPVSDLVEELLDHWLAERRRKK